MKAAESGDLSGVATAGANVAGTDTTAGQMIAAGGADANQLQQ